MYIPRKTFMALMFGFYACCSAQAEEIGNWVTTTRVDRFTDKRETIFTIRSRNVSAPKNYESLRVTMMLTCPLVDMKDGKKPFKFTTGMIYFTPDLHLYKTNFTYRFDKQKSESLYDPFARDNIPLGNLNFKKFVNNVAKSKTLLTRIYSEAIGSIEAEFDLLGSEEVIKQYYSVCGPID